MLEKHFYLVTAVWGSGVLSLYDSVASDLAPGERCSPYYGLFGILLLPPEDVLSQTHLSSVEFREDEVQAILTFTPITDGSAIFPYPLSTLHWI